MDLNISESEKNKIKELIDKVNKSSLIFLKAAMYHPEVFTLQDHMDQKISSDALNELREIFK